MLYLLRNKWGSYEIFSKDNVLNKAEKVEGSWFSDSGEVNNPKIIAKNVKATIYDVNFGNDEYSGRVIVPNVKKITSVTYAFSYDDDEGNRTSTSVLACE